MYQSTMYMHAQSADRYTKWRVFCLTHVGTTVVILYYFVDIYIWDAYKHDEIIFYNTL